LPPKKVGQLLVFFTKWVQIPDKSHSSVYFVAFIYIDGILNCYRLIFTFLEFMNRYIIAATDITSRPKAFAPMRGKTAKEIYRFSKGVVLSRSLSGPAAYAVISVPKEMSNGFIYSAIGVVGETVLGYVSGIGFVRWIYKATDVGSIKNLARLAYNVACLPITAYSKGASSVFDLLQLSKLEEYWFGTPVYIFDDNRLWIESNFTIEEVFKTGK